MISAPNTISGASLVALAVAGVLSQAPCAGAQHRIAIVAPQAIAPDGSLIDDGAAVIIEDGVIVSFTSDVDSIDADEVIRYESGVISPGLIDIGGAVGNARVSGERIQPIDPTVTASDGFDPGARTLEDAARAGVTSAMIAPVYNNPIPGVASIVRTWGANRAGEILIADGPLVVAFGPTTWNPFTGPTSRAGALNRLREEFSAAKGNGAEGRIAQAIAGPRDVFAVIDSLEDLSAMRRLSQQYGLSPVYRIQSDFVNASALLDESASVVIGPFMAASDPEDLFGAVRISDLGARVALCGAEREQSPDALRLSAATLVRYGMEPAAARRALTSDAAEIAGAADRIGALEAGLDADIVVFSHDPLRYDATVLDVWIAGEHVHSAAADRLAERIDQEYSFEVGEQQTEGGADDD